MGLNLLFVVALPVSVSISCWVGIEGVLEAMLSFESGLVFSCCAAGVVLAGVSFLKQGAVSGVDCWFLVGSCFYCGVCCSFFQRILLL